MQIGLIGGIGPAATDFYYRALIKEFASRSVPLDLTIVHADTPTLLRNLQNNAIDKQVAIYDRLTERLALAGAECVVVTSVAGHFCIDAFKERSPLRVIDMLQEVDRAITSRDLRRVGILGTRTVMETRFYSAITKAEVVPPKEGTLGKVHDAYVNMAANGWATEEHVAVFDSACRDLITKERVEAVMLGGTDLALIYNEEHASFPFFDCAKVHVDSIVEVATN